MNVAYVDGQFVIYRGGSQSPIVFFSVNGFTEDILKLTFYCLLDLIKSRLNNLHMMKVDCNIVFRLLYRTHL